MNKIEIRDINNTDISDAISLHNKYFEDRRTIKHWIWEYNTSYPDLSVFTVIMDNGVLVGTQGMIPIYLNIKGEKYLTGKSENSLLDSQYRGQGLFTQLYEYALARCETQKMCCVWGYTGVPSAIKVLRRCGFSGYDNAMKNAIIFMNLRKGLSNVLKSDRNNFMKILKFFSLIPEYLYCNIHRPIIKYLKNTKKEEFSIERKISSINDVDKLYTRLRKKYPDIIHINQDENYVKWRIHDNPNINYKTFYVYKNSLLKAYCYINISDEKIAYLTDFTFEDIEAGYSLMKTILRMLRYEKVSYMLFTGNTKNPLMKSVFKLFEEFGFIIKSSFTFVLKNINYENEDHLYNIENWYLNGLWTEGYKY